MKDGDVETLDVLVGRTLQGDIEAYAEIVQRFQYMAYGYAYALLGDAHLAEDAAQEAFIEALQNLAKLREADAFPGWLRRIVLKRTDRMLRRRRVRTVDMGQAEALCSRNPTPHEILEEAEMREAVLAAVRALPENERMATTLFYIHGHSQAATAAFLEVPVSTVNNRLHAARTRLQDRKMTMVKDTMCQTAAAPGALAERVAFLFRLTECLEGRCSVVAALAKARKAAKSAEMRAVIEGIEKDILSGSSLRQAFGKHEEIFPPMILWLIRQGEQLGWLQKTLRMAAEWLKTGGCSASPQLFREAGGPILGLVEKGRAAGATALLIDPACLLPCAEGKPACVWIECEKADGVREALSPFCNPGRLTQEVERLKAATTLKEDQEGDAIAGVLHLGCGRDGAEGLPIQFRPLRTGGEEIRIELE